IAAFSFGISPSSSDVTLTGASSVFFGADSFDLINGFPFVTSLGPPLQASDLSNSGIGPILGVGGTVTLGTVNFSVSAAAPTETVGITLIADPSTSVSDDSFADITGVLTGGSIRITGSTA